MVSDEGGKGRGVMGEVKWRMRSKGGVRTPRKRPEPRCLDKILGKLISTFPLFSITQFFFRPFLVIASFRTFFSAQVSADLSLLSL